MEKEMFRVIRKRYKLDFEDDIESTEVLSTFETDDMLTAIKKLKDYHEADLCYYRYLLPRCKVNNIESFCDDCYIEGITYTFTINHCQIKGYIESADRYAKDLFLMPIISN